MKTKAAVLWEIGTPWEIEELELDGPGGNEVLIRWSHAGLCHSDEHLRHGDIVPRFPIVGGHEGAGDHRGGRPGCVPGQAGRPRGCSFIPNCGVCRWCATGQQNICDMGATILDGMLPSGTFVFHGQRPRPRRDVHDRHVQPVRHHPPDVAACSVDDDLPLDKAVLVGCGVPTGWGPAVYAAKVEPGDTVVVYGIGGIGINAVQGARFAGAKPTSSPSIRWRTSARWPSNSGATHAVATAEEAMELALELTRGVGADKAIITVDVVDEKVVAQAFDTIRKGGTAVITGLADPTKLTVQLRGAVMTLYEKTVKGTLFGSGNPIHDIRNLIDLYQAGKLKLDELITQRYALDEVDQGYQDMLDGKNIRGVVVHER